MRARIGLGLVVLVLALPSLGEAQKGKPQLPKGWAKLGLSAEQKAKVYDILGTYRKKIEALERQIEALKTERDAAAVKVLTNE
jgi:cell division protein FtsB